MWKAGIVVELANAPPQWKTNSARMYQAIHAVLPLSTRDGSVGEDAMIPETIVSSEQEFFDREAAGDRPSANSDIWI